LAMSLLAVVEDVADVAGVSYEKLRAEYEKRNFAWDVAESYLLALLLEGGYLSKVEGMSPVPDYFQMTWKGHDLLDSMKLKHH